jgi:hypothetical protein
MIDVFIDTTRAVFFVLGFFLTVGFWIGMFALCVFAFNEFVKVLNKGGQGLW